MPPYRAEARRGTDRHREELEEEEDRQRHAQPLIEKD